MQQFFYSGQIRRYLTQFIRILSNFQVEFGFDRNNSIALQRVPVIYGDSSRQGMAILKQNSENYLNSVPAMAVYINELKYDRERVQNPTYVGKLNLRERFFDPSTGDFSTTQGDLLTVERLMPVPYRLTLKVDIWTSNTEQKLQLIEQISTLFNPSMEIQSTDNYVDWTSITYITLTDTTWSSRTVPIGTENPIDIATLTFELPIFLSAPALVKKLGVVQKIIASIFDSDGNIDEAIYSDANLMSRQYITPLQYGVILIDNTVKLVQEHDPVIDPTAQQVIKQLTSSVRNGTTVVVDNTDGIEPGMIVGTLAVTDDATPVATVSNNSVVVSIDGTTVTTSNVVTGFDGDLITFNAVTHKIGTNLPWRTVVNIYGNLVNGGSQIRFTLPDRNEVIGTVAYNPVDDTVLMWTPDIDTIPANTLVPVNAIIDPQNSRPNKDLQDLADGTRYLLVNDYITTPGAQPQYNWMGRDNTPLYAVANDIIQFNGQHWQVAFDSRATSAVNYVTNLTTSVQYKWDGAQWTKSYEGYYPAGQWQLII